MTWEKIGGRRFGKPRPTNQERLARRYGLKNAEDAEKGELDQRKVARCGPTKREVRKEKRHGQGGEWVGRKGGAKPGHDQQGISTEVGVRGGECARGMAQKEGLGRSRFRSICMREAHISEKGNQDAERGRGLKKKTEAIKRKRGRSGTVVEKAWGAERRPAKIATQTNLNREGCSLSRRRQTILRTTCKWGPEEAQTVSSTTLWLLGEGVRPANRRKKEKNGTSS